MMPTKFKLFYHEFKDKPFDLLDVGCGNHSPTEAKKVFEQVVYHGIDHEAYNNTEEDFKTMDRFHLVDLSKTSNLQTIPDDSYDCKKYIDNVKL